MKRLLQLVGVAGILAFGVLLFAVLAYPKVVDRSALGFVKSRIELEMRERFPDLGGNALVQGAQRLSAEIADDQKRVREALDGGLPELIAGLIAAHCGCAEKAAVVSAISDGMRRTLARLEVGQDRLGDMIRDRYDSIMSALRHELTIFLGTNLAAFALVLLAVTLRGESSRLVLLPASLLILAVGVSSGLYLFNQDWFYAIIFQDYVGFGYLAGMAVIFALLLDIVTNRGRVCRHAVAQLPGALGSVFVPPC